MRDSSHARRQAEPDPQPRARRWRRLLTPHPPAVAMGASSSKGPAITAQDRAVLEYVAHTCRCGGEHAADLPPLQPQAAARQGQAVPQEGASVSLAVACEEHSADAASPPAQLQYVLDAEHSAARAALARGDKERARTALRRRKWQEGMIAKTDTQLETLEGLVSLLVYGGAASWRRREGRGQASHRPQGVRRCSAERSTVLATGAQADGASRRSPPSSSRRSKSRSCMASSKAMPC
jgi:hypothetical protein